MAYHVVRPDELEFAERPADGAASRAVADLTTAVGLTQSRARLWRMPRGTRGTRHRELVQEEGFVVLEGTFTLALDDPPTRVDLPAGSVAAVEPGTPLQMRNDGTEDVLVLVWGAPPVAGQAEYLEDLGESF